MNSQALEIAGVGNVPSVSDHDRIDLEPHSDRLAAEPTGALVLGGDYRALTVVRSLGRHGIPVWVLTQRQKIAATSRYARRHLAFPMGPSDRQVRFLVDLAETYKLDGWAIFPTEDEHAALIARHLETLEQHFRVAGSTWESIAIAYDKRQTYQTAERLNISIPLTFYPHSRGELEHIDCGFPAILKPAIKDVVNRLTHAKAWTVDDRESLIERYEEASNLMDPDLILVQELIPGGGETQFSFGALCKDGRPLASITARRSRQYPIDFGRSSSFVETVDCKAVETIAHSLLAQLKYTGLIEVEFKLDQRSGVFKLLDLNPRVWGWHTLSTLGGVDFPFLYWKLLNNQSIKETRVQAGLRWIRMTTDLPAAASEMYRGRLSLREYFRSLRGPKELAVFAIDDLRPAIFEIPMLIVAQTRLRLYDLRRQVGLDTPQFGAEPQPHQQGASAPKPAI